MHASPVRQSGLAHALIAHAVTFNAAKAMEQILIIIDKRTLSNIVLAKICEPLDEAPAEPNMTGDATTLHESLAADRVQLRQNEPLPMTEGIDSINERDCGCVEMSSSFPSTTMRQAHPVTLLRIHKLRAARLHHHHPSNKHWVQIDFPPSLLAGQLVLPVNDGNFLTQQLFVLPFCSLENIISSNFGRDEVSK